VVEFGDICLDLFQQARAKPGLLDIFVVRQPPKRRKGQGPQEKKRVVREGPLASEYDYFY
jgi:hypothetical protein